MLTLLFLISMLMVFGRIAGVAVRMSWRLTKFILGLVFLPGILLLMFFGGLIYLACPILAIIGISSLLLPRNAM